MTETNQDTESKLPKYETYDTASLLSVHDVEAMTQGNMPESKVRSLLSLYCIEPVAERKIPKTRGRGLHLFARTDVEKAMAHYLSFFSER